MIDVATAWPNRNIATNLRIKAISGDEITYEVLPGISVEKVGSTSTSVGTVNIMYHI